MQKTLTIDESLKLLPQSPGVYLMYNNKQEIIYIGKARNLSRRVKSYFKKHHDSPKLAIMVPQIERFEFIITDSEVEALILESQLIKKHKPKYNVLLKDDKRFPWFLITDEEYPRIVITRKADNRVQKGRYFGPYTDSRAMYSTLELIKNIFPLRQCKTPRFSDRPCMYYQIGRCLAPCQKLVTPENYEKIVKDVGLFLSGKQTKLLEELKNRMETCAENQEYEKAARWRDSYFDVVKAVTRQKVVSENTSVNQDVIAFQNDEMLMAVVLLKIREGRLIAKEDFDVRLDGLHSPYEAFVAFLQEYYGMIDASEIPSEVLIDIEIEDDDETTLSEWLSSRKQRKINLITPKLQKKYELVEMAKKNAESAFENLRVIEMNNLRNEWNEIGSFIQERLALPRFPNRIECFDISHIQGTNTVASMVVFVDGKPSKSDYRKYKLRTLPEGQTDDFAAMKEVIKRRYQHVLKGGAEATIPDLIVIDGGKGQLSAAMEVLDELGLGDFPIVSLAKKFEEIYLPGKSKPVVFPAGSNALFLFQQVRDEAHRFAINYHRKLREKNAIKSALDELPELTISHKKILFEYFGDMEGILNANKSELVRLLGKYRGYRLYKHLHSAS